MGLFSRRVRIDRDQRYRNQITDKFEQVLNSRYAGQNIYLRETGDGRFLSLYLDGVSEAVGSIKRNDDNTVGHACVFSGAGCPNVFVASKADLVCADIMEEQLTGIPNPL